MVIEIDFLRFHQRLEFEDPELDFGTADHLYEIIRWADSDAARQILEFSRSGEISLIYYITDLWVEAHQDVEQGFDVASIENVMFLPIH